MSSSHIGDCLVDNGSDDDEEQEDTKDYLKGYFNFFIMNTAEPLKQMNTLYFTFIQSHQERLNKFRWISSCEGRRFFQQPLRSNP